VDGIPSRGGGKIIYVYVIIILREGASLSAGAVYTTASPSLENTTPLTRTHTHTRGEIAVSFYLFIIIIFFFFLIDNARYLLRAAPSLYILVMCVRVRERLTVHFVLVKLDKKGHTHTHTHTDRGVQVQLYIQSCPPR
jgi:hypothetical protein